MPFMRTEDVSRSAASSCLHNESAEVKEDMIPWMASLIKRVADGGFHNVINDAKFQPVSLIPSAPCQDSFSGHLIEQ